MGVFKAMLKEGASRAMKEFEKNSGRKLTDEEKLEVGAIRKAYKDIIGGQQASHGVSVLESAKFDTVKKGIEKVVEYLNERYPVAERATTEGTSTVRGQPVRSPILEDVEATNRDYMNRIRGQMNEAASHFRFHGSR